MKDSQEITITLAEEQTDEEWDKICWLIKDYLQENDYEPFEVVIY